MYNEQLARFLAHSVELESEARDRYEELAESMAAHNNRPVAEFFQRMAHEARQHLAEVEDLVGSTLLPQLQPWEFHWPHAEPPETASYEALHYRMSLQQAMRLALANERAAEDYYRQAGEAATDAETRRLALLFATEEASHAAELERLLDELGAEPAHQREDDDEPNMPE